MASITDMPPFSKPKLCLCGQPATVQTWCGPRCVTCRTTLVFDDEWISTGFDRRIVCPDCRLELRARGVLIEAGYVLDDRYHGDECADCGRIKP